MLHTNPSSGAATIDQPVADVPSGLSTVHRKKLKKNKTLLELSNRPS
jgi:hypothetical protein